MWPLLVGWDLERCILTSLYSDIEFWSDLYVWQSSVLQAMIGEMRRTRGDVSVLACLTETFGLKLSITRSN